MDGWWWTVVSAISFRRPPPSYSAISTVNHTPCILPGGAVIRLLGGPADLGRCLGARTMQRDEEENPIEEEEEDFDEGNEEEEEDGEEVRCAFWTQLFYAYMMAG